jgi:hypothetical protein
LCSLRSRVSTSLTILLHLSRLLQHKREKESAQIPVANELL